MTIEINEPKTEALLKQWMSTGQFRSPEDVIGTVLEAAVMPESANKYTGRTGADFLAAMQSCPYPDFLPEPEKAYMPVRNPVEF